LPRDALCDATAFCARIARLEADKYARALGRRRRSVLHGRHLDCSPAALVALKRAGAFASAPPLP
jgi:hypothetical protein